MNHVMNIGSRLIGRQVFSLLILLSGFSIQAAYSDEYRNFHEIDLQHLRSILSKAKITEVDSDQAVVSATESGAKKDHQDQWCARQIDALRNLSIPMRTPKPVAVFSGPEALDHLANYKTNESTLRKLCPGKFEEIGKPNPNSSFFEIYRLPGQPKHNLIIFEQSVGTVQGFPRTSGWYEVDAKTHGCTASFGFDVADNHPSDPPGTPPQQDSLRELVDVYKNGQEAFFYNAVMGQGVGEDKYFTRGGTLLLYRPQYFFTPRAEAEADPVIAQSTHQPDASYVCRIQFTF